MKLPNNRSTLALLTQHHTVHVNFRPTGLASVVSLVIDNPSLLKLRFKEANFYPELEQFPPSEALTEAGVVVSDYFFTFYRRSRMSDICRPRQSFVRSVCGALRYIVPQFVKACQRRRIHR